MHRATPLRSLAVLAFPGFLGACSADAGDTRGAPLVDSSTVSNADPGEASPVVTSATSTAQPSVQPTAAPDLIDSLGGPGGAGPSPTGEEACKLAILGDPGSNPGANFAAWIEKRGPVVDRFLAGPDLEAFTLADLQRYQVLLLDFLAPSALLGLAPEELMTWAEGGGRIIALSGYGDYPEVVSVQNRMLAPLLLGFVSDTPVWGPVTRFEPHPITAGLQSLTFVGGREVSHDPLDEVIMTVSEAAVPVGVVATRGAGRLFLFGDEWVTFDSEWVAMPEIEQFWVNVFDWLGGCKLTPIPMIK